MRGAFEQLYDYSCVAWGAVACWVWRGVLYGGVGCWLGGCGVLGVLAVAWGCCGVLVPGVVRRGVHACGVPSNYVPAKGFP